MLEQFFAAVFAGAVIGTVVTPLVLFRIWDERGVARERFSKLSERLGLREASRFWEGFVLSGRRGESQVTLRFSLEVKGKWGWGRASATLTATLPTRGPLRAVVLEQAVLAPAWDFPLESVVWKMPRIHVGNFRSWGFPPVACERFFAEGGKGLLNLFSHGSSPRAARLRLAEDRLTLELSGLPDNPATWESYLDKVVKLAAAAANG